jgi:hypothetical protein
MTTTLRTIAVAVVAFAAGIGFMLTTPANATHREGTGDGNQVVRRTFGNDVDGYSLRYTNGDRETFPALSVALDQCAGVTSHVDRVQCSASTKATYMWLTDLVESTRYWHNRVVRAHERNHSAPATPTESSGPTEGSGPTPTPKPCPTPTEPAPTTGGSGPEPSSGPTTSTSTTSPVEPAPTTGSGS